MHDSQAHIPQVGEIAPDFTLTSTSGQHVQLSSLRGTKNVLLAFFPLAFTSTCTAEVCAFTDDFDQFAVKDVEVLPLSVDSTATLKEYQQKYSLKIDMLSDFKRIASRAYGVLRDDTYYSNRAYFLIDKTGVVRWMHVEDAPRNRRENAEIFAEIAKLSD